MRTWKRTDNEKFYELSRQIGREIIKLARGKKSFGSFFLEGYSKEVMTYLPYFQQAVWGVPMNAEGAIWEYHQFGQLDQIKNYDFAIILKYRSGSEDNILIEKAEEYGEDKYFIVIQAKDEENVGDIRSCFFHFMTDNPYLPKHSLSDNPVKFND